MNLSQRTEKNLYIWKIQNERSSQNAIFEYISCFYNGKRIHLSIGYFTPIQYERMYQSVA
ncbi:IS3 family transposase [Paenibacillus ehimensis]|uniref:IS3 family transposase n=1 Tax=Paenibacillus ehimensis TaxID=79264 RepID=UPI000A0579A1